MDEEKLSPSVRRDQLDFSFVPGLCKIAFSLQFLVVCIPFTVYAGGDIEARRDAEHQGHAIAEDTRRRCREEL
jgi:hypothetical protein